MARPQKFQPHEQAEKTQEKTISSNSSPFQNSTSEQQLHRLFSVTACRTQAELAQYMRSILGVSLSSVRSGIKKIRDGADIPATWLVALSRSKGVPPEWILTGNGPSVIFDTKCMLTFPDFVYNHYSSDEFLQANLCAQEALRHFSTQILLFEILHREYIKPIIL